MKPCPENKKLIAWLALDELDENAAAALRAHLDTCAGCREHWRQLSAVSREHSALANAPVAASASRSFHRRLSERIREDQEASVAGRIQSLLRHWLFERYPVAQIATAIIGLIFVGAIIFAIARLGVHGTSETIVIALDSPPARPEVSPTLSAYRMAANDSLEALDDLLTKEAARQNGNSETLTMFALRKVDPEN